MNSKKAEEVADCVDQFGCNGAWFNACFK